MKAPNGHAASPSGNGELILMVDDEKSVLDMASIVFRLSGYQVLAIDSALTAYEVYEKRKGEIALAILDLAMPCMDGIELSRILVQINPKVKIIISSGQATPPKELELRRLGIRHFLPKPYTVHQLLSLVHEVIHAKG